MSWWRTMVGGKAGLSWAVPIIQPPLMHPVIGPPCASAARVPKTQCQGTVSYNITLSLAKLREATRVVMIKSRTCACRLRAHVRLTTTDACPILLTID